MDSIYFILFIHQQFRNILFKLMKCICKSNNSDDTWNIFFWYLTINLCHVQTQFDCRHCVKVFKKLKRVWLNQTSIDIYKWMISLLKYICLIIYKIYAWKKSKKDKNQHLATFSLLWKYKPHAKHSIQPIVI